MVRAAQPGDPAAPAEPAAPQAGADWISADRISADRVCPRCANLARSAARFCDACGGELSQPSLFDSEIKYVTVLFGDVVNSTELIAARSPEQAKAALTPAVNAMLHAVQAFGGAVHSVLGDGVMALFGAPVSQEDHATRACCAAMRMHEAMHALPGPLQLRVGLASGPTLLSALAGGDLRAFGATIHLASRLQALARPGTTLCAGATQAVAGSIVELVPLGPHAVRGFGMRQDVFALTGLNSPDLRFAQPANRALSPHVGRERELAELETCADQVQAGTAAAVAIVADAGFGKSRLAWEFSQRLVDRGWALVQTGAASYGRDLPYQLVGALLHAAFGLDPREPPDRAVHRLRTELGAAGAATHVPALLSLLALPLGADADAWDALDPLRRRDAIADGVRAAIEAVDRPTLLLIEDLQWADDESLKALDFTPGAPSHTLLLTTHRPDFAPPWHVRRPRVIVLEAMPPETMDRLLTQAFPNISGTLLRRTLLDRAGGNPFFLEELARDLLTEQNTPFPEPSTVPATIQSMLAARIDRLAPANKRLALTAAALGTRFPLRTLRGLFVDETDTAFRGRLATLAQAGIVQPLEPAAKEVAFAHALVQEVAYAGLPTAQRRDLHRSIASSLQNAAGSDAGESAETLVYHASRGEAWEALVDAARTAGRRAARQSAYVAASRFYKQAIEACRRLSSAAATLAAEIDLRFALRVTLFPTAEIDQSLANSTEAQALARELGDPVRLGWATAYLARDLQLVGRPREAVAMAARALETGADNPELHFAARYYAAQAAYSTGDYADAASALFNLVGTLEIENPNAWTGTTGPAVIIFRAWLIWSLARLGRDAEAIAEAARMRELSEAADLPLGQTIAHLSEGFALAHADRLPEAEAALRTSLALCRKWELFAWSTNIFSCLGHVLSRLGRFEEAFDLLSQAIERTTRSGILVNHAHELAWLAEAHRLDRHPRLAIRHAEQAITVARDHDERGNEALANAVLGAALADAGEPAAARARLERAFQIASDLRMTPLAGECMLQLARLRPGKAAPNSEQPGFGQPGFGQPGSEQEWRQHV